MNTEADAGPVATPARWVWPALALAVLLVALNTLSPLHVDDPFIGQIARQIVEQPADPYGFEIFWLQWPQPVHEELTPPVVPYWWALGLLLFGARSWAIKLWFLPFVAALAVGLAAILRRCAPGVERPFLVLALLSPAVAPALNLMQDIPAYGLASAGVALYLAAAAATGAARGNGLALAAGLLLGLALQSKYPVATFVAAVALHGLLVRRIGRSTIATVTALLIFGAWELFGVWRYGQGMFSGQLSNSMYWVPREAMLLPLLRLLGGTLGATAVAALLALRLPRVVALGVGLLGVAGYAALFVAPVSAAVLGALGLISVVALVAAALTLISGRFDPLASSGSALEARMLSWWLSLWWGGELIGFFVTAPFPATRRVIGPALVGTLLVARLWSLAGDRRRREALAFVAAAGAVLGVLHVTVDTLEARAQREAVVAAAQAIDATPQSTIWFAGHWGFGDHARAAGWQPVVPEASELRTGDWLVVPTRVDRQGFVLPRASLERRLEIRLPAGLPLATLPGYYAGSTPLDHLAAERLRVDLYRVRRGFRATTDWPTQRLTDYALRSPRQTATGAFPALAERMTGGPGSSLDDRRLAAAVLSKLAGPDASELLTGPFLGALDDDDATVRFAAASGLGRLGPAVESRTLRSLAGLAEDDPDEQVRAAAANALLQLTPAPR